MTLKQRASQLAQELPAVFLALRHKDTPLLAKLLAGVTVCYALSPIDLIPDFVPVLGYLDDLLILPALVAVTVRLIPPSVISQCRQQSAQLWRDGKPKKWYYALPIAALWLLVLGLLLRAVLKRLAF